MVVVECPENKDKTDMAPSNPMEAVSVSGG